MEELSTIDLIKVLTDLLRSYRRESVSDIGVGAELISAAENKLLEVINSITV